MATAVGAYATLANVKTRLGITDTTDDTLITSLCNEVNQSIETYTGRVLAPWPIASTGLFTAASAGATSITVGSATNIKAGMRLFIGALNTSGSGEAVTVASSYTAGSTTVPLAFPQGYTSTWSGLTAAYASNTAVNTAYLYDGMDVLEGGRLIPLDRGFGSITQVRAGFYTGDTLKLVPATNWYARPNDYDREPGWPYTELWMTDIPTTDNPVPLFQANLTARSGFFANIELVGQPGWTSIPDDVAEVAENLAVALYRARGAGGADSFTIGEDGSRTYSRMFSWSDRLVLDRYKLKWVGVA